MHGGTQWVVNCKCVWPTVVRYPLVYAACCGAWVWKIVTLLCILLWFAERKLWMWPHWVTVWRPCSLEKTGTPIDEDNFNFGCPHTSGSSRPHCPICAGDDTQSATDQCRHSLIKESSQKIGLSQPEGQKCQDPERAEIAVDANWGGVKETFVLFWASSVHTDPDALQLLYQCCRTDAHEMFHGIEPSVIQVILSRCSLVPFYLKMTVCLLLFQDK